MPNGIGTEPMGSAGCEIDLREIGVGLVGGVEKWPNETEQKKESDYYESGDRELIAREARTQGRGAVSICGSAAGREQPPPTRTLNTHARPPLTRGSTTRCTTSASSVPTTVATEITNTHPNSTG